MVPTIVLVERRRFWFITCSLDIRSGKNALPQCDKIQFNPEGEIMKSPNSKEISQVLSFSDRRSCADIDVTAATGGVYAPAGGNSTSRRGKAAG